MTKYISYKIFDSDDYTDDDFKAILLKQKIRYYATVHGDYALKVIEAELNA